MHIGSHASRRQVKRMAEMQQALVSSFAHKKSRGSSTGREASRSICLDFCRLDHRLPFLAVLGDGLGKLLRAAVQRLDAVGFE